jgi:hypothetical protein
VVIEGLWDSVMLMDRWLGPGNDRWKTAPVAACGEEERGVWWPWLLRTGVSLARGWGSNRWWLRHSTWLRIGDGLPSHNGGRAGAERCGMRKGKGGNSPRPRGRFIGSGNLGATAMVAALLACTWGSGAKPWAWQCGSGIRLAWSKHRCSERPLTGGLH